MNRRELCSRNLVRAPSDAPLEDIARLMRGRHVDIVVLTKAPADEPAAAGVITDRDIACTLLDRMRRRRDSRGIGFGEAGYGI